MGVLFCCPNSRPAVGPRNRRGQGDRRAGRNSHELLGFIAETALLVTPPLSRAKIGRDCSQLLQLPAITPLIPMPAHACAIQARGDCIGFLCSLVDSRHNAKNERARACTTQSTTQSFSEAPQARLGPRSVITPPSSGLRSGPQISQTRKKRGLVFV